MLLQREELKRFDIRRSTGKITVVACGSATGQVILPTIIFEAKRLIVPGPEVKMNCLEQNMAAVTLVGSPQIYLRLGFVSIFLSTQ